MIKEISEDFYKRWILKNIDDDIFIWNFLAFVGSEFLDERDERKEKEIVWEIYNYWFFTRQSLNVQLNYTVDLIYNLFLKIKIWKQNKKN